MSMDTAGEYTVAGILAFSFMYLSYLLFRDTKNRIQYVEHLKLYWIAKEHQSSKALRGVPFVSTSFMRQTQKPYWYGKGIEFRFFKWTFDIGILQGKGEDPIFFETVDASPQEIRDWGRPE
jgi:hypothetical protein